MTAARTPDRSSSRATSPATALLPLAIGPVMTISMGGVWVARPSGFKPIRLVGRSIGRIERPWTIG